MKYDKKRVVTAALALAIIAAVVIGGLVWTVSEGVRSAKFIKTVATVTSCETEKFDEKDVNVKVTVDYEADGGIYKNATFIGDLNRCSEGMRMYVYYQKDGDRSYVYSKPGDLGFALIMLCGGAVWAGIAAVVTVCLKNAGYFRGTSGREVEA